MRAKEVILYAAIILFSKTSMAEQKIYHIDGVVDGVSKDSVIIHSDIGLIELKREQMDKNAQSNISVGDHVLVSYTLDVQKIELKDFLGNSKQQPGQVGPSHTPILDDRVFYDAKNS